MKKEQDIGREERIRRVIRRNAAHYDHVCFEMFLWYPLPDNTWRMMKGSGDPAEWHYHLWADQGVKRLAQDWGIDPKLLWAGAGDNAIPTGYVDFKEENFRDVPFLVLPDPLPSGWTVDKVKDNLKCGQRIKDVVSVERRRAKPIAVDKLLRVLRDLKTYGSMGSEMMVD